MKSKLSTTAQNKVDKLAQQAIKKERTNAETMNRHAQKITAHICALMGISPAYYHNEQFNKGCEYLESIYPNDKDRQRSVNQNPVFWAWWRSQWAAREFRWLHEYETLDVQLWFDQETQLPSLVTDGMSEAELLNYWETHHNMPIIIEYIRAPNGLF